MANYFGQIPFYAAYGNAAKKQQNESESLWLLPASGFFTSKPNELVDSNYTIRS